MLLNSTRNVTQTWENVKSELRTNKNATNCTEIIGSPAAELGSQEAGFYSLLRAYESLQNNGEENNEEIGGMEIDQTDEKPNSQVTELSEEQKKLLWESLRLSGGGEEEEEQVPE